MLYYCNFEDIVPFTWALSLWKNLHCQYFSSFLKFNILRLKLISSRQKSYFQDLRLCELVCSALLLVILVKEFIIPCHLSRRLTINIGSISVSVCVCIIPQFIIIMVIISSTSVWKDNLTLKKCSMKVFHYKSIWNMIQFHRTKMWNFPFFSGS